MAIAARAITAPASRPRSTKAGGVETFAVDLAEAAALLKEQCGTAAGTCRACTPRYRTCGDYVDELVALADELPAVAAELVVITKPGTPDTCTTRAAAAEIVMQLHLAELRAAHLTLRLREAGPAHDAQVVVADAIVWLLARVAQLLSDALAHRL